jgi:DNA-binding transcriptional ArsR family regulator
MTLKALADPTRRLLLERLRESPCTVSQLTESAQISQPAVSQHLGVLREAGLVQVKSDGTRRIYSLSAGGLVELRGYIDELWDDVLAAFAEAAFAGAASSETAQAGQKGEME